MSPLAEHDFVARSHAAVRMAGTIPFPEIGFDFNDAPDQQPPAEPPEYVFSGEIACDRERGPEVERTGKPDGGCCGRGGRRGIPAVAFHFLPPGKVADEFRRDPVDFFG